MTQSLESELAVGGPADAPLVLVDPAAATVRELLSELARLEDSLRPGVLATPAERRTAHERERAVLEELRHRNPA